MTSARRFAFLSAEEVATLLDAVADQAGDREQVGLDPDPTVARLHHELTQELRLRPVRSPR